MGNRDSQRSAISLLELLVVLALIGLLLGLLLPAVQKVRDAANRLQSANHLKQIALATQNYAGDHDGRLPSLSGDIQQDGGTAPTNFVQILPYIEQGNLYEAFKARFPGNTAGSFLVRLYLNPADPSLRGVPEGPSSYAANALVFLAFPRRSRLEQITDGLSNTIMYAQHYAQNCGGRTQFDWSLELPFGFGPGVDGISLMRPCTFAEERCGDVVPVTAGDPPVTGASVSEVTFQTRPSIRECDPRIAQSPHPGGMPVAMCDGSVRTLASGMSPSTYWAAVTPDRGETLEGDW
jgi:prepilin-type processing-associated H-X9-DG protein